jgi:hypothetical protein
MAEGQKFEYPKEMTDDEIARLGILVSEVDRPVQSPLPRTHHHLHLCRLTRGLLCLHHR